MNPHLNIFRFFNSQEEHHLEDNLSRAFSLCLKYDAVFLDKVLQSVLPKEKYDQLFDTDFPDYEIEIDLQTRVNELNGFTTVIGVACSGTEVAEFKDVIPRETDSPETDVCIRVNDTCLVFEFKRTSENCAAQLKGQVEKIIINNPGLPGHFVDLSWGKIIRILLNVASLQKQLNSENPFTRDFLGFLEGFPADWFPTRRLANIPFPKDTDDPNYRMLNRRLNQLKTEVYGEDGISEYSGTFKRLVIKAEFGWINEVNIGPFHHNGQNYLDIAMHLGDTKEQGRPLFEKMPNGVGEIEEVLGFKTYLLPYIKLSSMRAKGLSWILPSPDEAANTHTRIFFDEFAGKWNRPDWTELDEKLSRLIPNWKDKCCLPNLSSGGYWNQRFLDSNQTGLLLSVGTYFRVLLPYELCQQMDDEPVGAKIVSTFRDIIEEIRKIIDT